MPGTNVIIRHGACPHSDPKGTMPSRGNTEHVRYPNDRTAGILIAFAARTSARLLLLKKYRINVPKASTECKIETTRVWQPRLYVEPQQIWT